MESTSPTALHDAPLPPAPPAGPEQHAPRPTQRRRVTWPARNAARVGLVVLLLYLAVRLVWITHVVFFALFLGVLFGLEVAAGTTWLARYRVPRGLGAGLIITGFMGVLVGFALWLAPELRTQSRELRTKLPEAVDKVDIWLGGRANGLLSVVLGSEDDDPAAPAAGQPARTPAPVLADSAAARAQRAASRDSVPPRDVAATGTRLRRRLVSRFGTAQRSWFPVLSSTAAAVTGFLLIVFIAGYIGAEPELYHGGLLRLVPRSSRGRAEAVLSALGTTLRRWLLMQLIAMVVIGGVTTAFLVVLRVPAALPLGILAGLLKFIPTVGSIIAALPAVAMAFIDSPHKAIVVAIGYTVIQFLENHLVIPILMKRGVALPPALTLAAQAVMALLFGFIGLLVAVPILAAISVLVNKLYVERLGSSSASPIS